MKNYASGKAITVKANIPGSTKNKAKRNAKANTWALYLSVDFCLVN